MRIIRIYHPTSLEINQTVQLTAEASHHLARVLRAIINMPLQIFDGHGEEYQARIISITKNSILVNIENKLSLVSESPLQIHLGQCIARNEKMDYVIQKAVELGVKKITPLSSEFSEVKLTAERSVKRLAHWRAIIINACEQSGRNYLPEIVAPISLTEWFHQIQAELKLILHPKTAKQLSDFKTSPNTVAITIGPEGGFSATEIELATNTGFHPLSLGPRILRSETAGPAIISALQTRWGDF